MNRRKGRQRRATPGLQGWREHMELRSDAPGELAEFVPRMGGRRWRRNAGPQLQQSRACVRRHVCVRRAGASRSLQAPLPQRQAPTDLVRPRWAGEGRRRSRIAPSRRERRPCPRQEHCFALQLPCRFPCRNRRDSKLPRWRTSPRLTGLKTSREWPSIPPHAYAESSFVNCCVRRSSTFTRAGLVNHSSIYSHAGLKETVEDGQSKTSLTALPSILATLES